MTGQESFTVAQAFEQSVGFDVSMLSKMDSDARGGAAFAFRYALKKPIIFAGIGEKVADIEHFIRTELQQNFGYGRCSELNRKSK